MRTRVFENENGNRFWLYSFKTASPCVVRSALDACEGENEDLQAQLNDLAERIYEISPSIASDTIANMLASLGYVCVSDETKSKTA